jgi:hypothetical protein
MMTAWIVTNRELWRKTPELRRGEIRGWLKMNGIDPTKVPLESEILVHENSEGFWVIDFEEYRTDERGRILIDPSEPDKGYVQARTVPMDVDPPLYLLTEKQ